MAKVELHNCLVAEYHDFYQQVCYARECTDFDKEIDHYNEVKAEIERDPFSIYLLELKFPNDDCLMEEAFEEVFAFINDIHNESLVIVYDFCLPETISDRFEENLVWFLDTAFKFTSKSVLIHLDTTRNSSVADNIKQALVEQHKKTSDNRSEFKLYFKHNGEETEVVV